MAEAIATIDSNTIVKLYIFRFGSSDKTVQLTQEQLDSIPYLATLVAHNDDFLPAQNENGEYVLNYPIEYSWFMSILRSITTKNPYNLFDELGQDVNVLDMLQLYDYLGIKSFSLPLLKDTDLVLSNPIDVDNEKSRVEYHEANLSEARQTAAEFIIALAKNEYKLSDSHTVKHIFSLINSIFSNVSVFSSRFRHHTLVVVKECCYSLFSKKQQHLLPTTQQIAQHNKIESLMYLYDNDKSLPDNFQNTFSWKGVYVTIEENLNDFTDTNDLRVLNMERRQLEHQLIQILKKLQLKSDILIERHIDKLPIYEIKASRMNNKTQFPQSKHFNILPKRQNVEKIKHRYGLKPQKYR